MGTGEFHAGGNPATEEHPIEGGSTQILQVASCHRNQDKLQPDGVLDSYTDFTFLLPNRVVTKHSDDT